ncbi:MAG TPA: CPXCG motif-containing cysteine-rich protein [Candidatus Polarisedimenticolaceae bacterium]|nr:CPXCG motif-containing cysteine-rich protein [Candidatus Polarisedimenticolaceae bacterium]
MRRVNASYVCGYCGQVVETMVDVSAGGVQRYVEDCSVCCRPNVLHVTLDPETEEPEIQAEFEG